MPRDPYKYFRVEARDLADQLGRSVIELERTSAGGEIVPRLLRLAHTLKGAARVVRLPAIAEHAHTIEDLLTPFRDTTIGVPHEDIEALLALLDRITEGIEGLDSPPPAPDVPIGTTALERPTTPLRADSSDLDALIRNVTAASAELTGLAHLVQVADQAQRLTDQVIGQLSAIGTSTKDFGALDSFELMRTLVSDLQRSATSTHQKVERELRQLRETAEQLRLVPAGAMFAALDRGARDTAQLLGKEITFTTEGGDIRLDGQSLRTLQDAMLQLVRNAVAHGVEVQRDRIAAGKPPRGRVGVQVSRRARNIVFRCEDDGRGIDSVALREAARSKGRVIAAEGDGKLARLLLEGGVSTSPFVSEAAGRGVGMDIVRQALGALKGELSVGTEPGKGSWFEVSIPLSLSSVECVVIEAEGVQSSIPLASVRRTRWLGPADIHRTDDGEAIIEDGRSLPLIALRGLLTATGSPAADTKHPAIIIHASAGLAALSVDRVVGTGTIVYRPLPVLAPASDAIEGASLRADGTPMLLLNPEGVVAAAGRHRPSAPAVSDRKRPLLIIDDSLTTRMLEQSILESAGYQVDMAVSAEEGLERVRARDYGLILVDVEMPGMDGFGFVTELRRDPKTRAIPAILITSRNADEDKRRGAEVGAQGYVVKSEFDQAALLGRIHQLVT